MIKGSRLCNEPIIAISRERVGATAPAQTHRKYGNIERDVLQVDDTVRRPRHLPSGRQTPWDRALRLPP